jgi:hypothetical protein
MIPQGAQIIFLKKSKVQKMLKIFSYPDEETASRSDLKYPRGQWRISGFIAADNYLVNVIEKTIKHYLENNAYEFKFLSSEIILERILQNLNNKILPDFNDVSYSKKAKATTSEIDMALVFVKDKEIALTGCGNALPLLVRRGRNQSNGRETSFNLINLLDEAQEGADQNKFNNEFNFEHGFQNIILGEVLPGDVLIISTKELWEFINNEQLLDGILKLPPKSAVEFLRNKIDNEEDLKVKNNLWGGFLILSWRTREMYLEAAKTVGKSNASLFQFVNLTKETEKILASSLKNISIKDTFKFFLKSKQAGEDSGEAAAPKEIVKGWQKKYRFVFQTLAKIVFAAFLAAKTCLVFLFLLGRKLFFACSDRRRKGDTVLKNVDLGFERVISKIIFRFNLLPQKSRTCLVLTVALSILFSQSVFVVNARLGQKLEREQTAQTIQTIRADIAGVEASLIYKDTQTAYNHLKESLNLFETLPKKTRQDKVQREEVAKEIDKARFLYQRNSIISDPTIITAFSGTKGKRILKAGEKLIVAADNNGIFFVEPTDRKAEFLTTVADPSDTLRLLGNYGVSEILFLKNNDLFSLNTQNKVIRSVSWTPPQINLEESLVYLHLNLLYVLDAVQNKLLKIPGGLKGFGKPGEYLKDTVDVGNVLTLAGDTAVYLLSEKDGVLKFNQGRKEEMDWTPLDPPLLPSGKDDSPRKMWTSDDSLFLYILDPTGKRLIVYNKNGNLKKQYTSPQFDELTDFAVNEKDKEIFILNGNKIYGIIAEHLLSENE